MCLRHLLWLSLCLAITGPLSAQGKHKALIVDGQNNHAMWPKTTFMMKQYLEQTDLFTVDIARTRFTWKGDDLLEEYSVPGIETESRPEAIQDPNFKPDFSAYDVVISNFGWKAAPWPTETQRALAEYIRGGGGFVVVHAASNSWGQWREFTRVIGIGGWDGQLGKHVFFDSNGKEVRSSAAGEKTGSHGSQHEFQVVVRQPDHPIVQGMPRAWLHAKDELYDRLRGPAEEMHVLATAYSSSEHGGTGRHEPMIMTVGYGKGRVFHTPMGHADYSVACVGFIVTFQRGTEWAATGAVTQTEIPADFPQQGQSSQRAY